jgi:hypothetical protein
MQFKDGEQLTSELIQNPKSKIQNRIIFPLSRSRGEMPGGGRRLKRSGFLKARLSPSFAGELK